MEIGGGGSTTALSWQVDSKAAGSSSGSSLRKYVDLRTGGARHVRELDRLRSQVTATRERRAFVLNNSVDRIMIEAGARASVELKSAWPKLSAATLHRSANAIPLTLAILALAATITKLGTIVLAMAVLLPAAFRTWVVTVARPADLPVAQLFPGVPDEDWPMYSIIAPLRGETRVVDQLLSAIERLDYPPEKLDVILAVEADDTSTRAAITARKHRIPVTVIPVAPAELRTKPKALNVALALARGTFTVIYDAEDRPERNQLRRALRAFRHAGNDLACVQARLCADTRTSWLSRYFTAEYAGHFDIFLPRLAALGLPLPLGGSSNHFRTATLREVIGWDPHNVTEDADLGFRLARFGYRCGVIDSTTYEEATDTISAWLGQRTRWFKGWMQTWLVHMRQPTRLYRELGFGGFLTFQLVVGGNALVALAHPSFLVAMGREFIALILTDDGEAAISLLPCYLLAAGFGYCASAAINFLGLAQRGMLSKAKVLLLTPLHWILLSLAAWLAALELIRKPYFWKKTEHGLDRDSRQDGRLRALLDLGRLLGELKRSGRLQRI
jgi:glycosyltransferase XagB